MASQAAWLSHPPPPGVVLQHLPLFVLHPVMQGVQAVLAWARLGHDRLNLPHVLVLVSPSVLELGLPQLLVTLGVWPTNFYCAVMGQQSAALAQHFGVPFDRIVAPGPYNATAEDAEGLLSCLQERFAPHVAYVALCQGAHARADLAPRLAAWAKQCSRHICYEMKPLDHPDTVFLDLVHKQQDLALWATSSAALRALHQQLDKACVQATPDFCVQVPVLATHSNIAQCATGLGFARVHQVATGIQSAYAWLHA